MSDGRGVYEAHSPEAVIDLLQKGQGVFAIALDQVWNDLEGTLSKRRRAAAGGVVSARAEAPVAPIGESLPKSDTVRFAHASERQFAQLLDFYGIPGTTNPPRSTSSGIARGTSSADSPPTSSFRNSISTSRSRR